MASSISQPGGLVTLQGAVCKTTMTLALHPVRRPLRLRSAKALVFSTSRFHLQVQTLPLRLHIRLHLRRTPLPLRPPTRLDVSIDSNRANYASAAEQPFRVCQITQQVVVTASRRKTLWSGPRSSSEQRLTT